MNDLFYCFVYLPFKGFINYFLSGTLIKLFSLWMPREISLKTYDINIVYKNFSLLFWGEFPPFFPPWIKFKLN